MRDATGAADVVVNGVVFWFIAKDKKVLLFGQPVCGEVVLDKSTALFHVTSVHVTGGGDIGPGDVDAVTEVTEEGFALDSGGGWGDGPVEVGGLEASINGGTGVERTRHAFFFVYTLLKRV